MGMFDYFSIEDYSIHPQLEKIKPSDEEPYLGAFDWQTKSLDCLLDVYVLTKEKTLYKNEVYDSIGEKNDTPESKFFPYSGSIDIGDYRVLEFWSEEELEGLDYIYNRPKVVRCIDLKLIFNCGVLSDVSITSDTTEQLKKPKNPSLRDHINQVMDIDKIPLERKGKIYIYGFVLEKGINGQWAVYDNRQTVCVNNIKGGCVPYIAEEGPWYVYLDEYDASIALQNFAKLVKSGEHDDKDYIR